MKMRTEKLSKDQKRNQVNGEEREIPPIKKRKKLNRRNSCKYES